MGGHAGGGDDHAEALFTGGGGEITGLFGGSVGGINMNFVGNGQFVQGSHGLLQDRQIAVAAHDDSNFFHIDLLQNKKGRTKS